MNFDAVGPSVVESLAFWIASAMYLPGAFQCPKVGTEVDDAQLDIPSIAYDVLVHGSQAVLALCQI